MVLRRQTFAGHTLAIVGFPGAAGAVLVGVSADVGFFAFCVAAALVIAACRRGTGGGYSEESAVIGTVQAFALACGFLFVSLYGGNLSGVNALLFGSFLGITDRPGRRARRAVGAPRSAALAVIGPAAAVRVGRPRRRRRRGVPVRLLSARSSWCCSAWPPARPARSPARCWCSRCSCSRRPPPSALTARPGAGRRAVGRASAVAVTWLGLALAYYSQLPDRLLRHVASRSPSTSSPAPRRSRRPMARRRDAADRWRRSPWSGARPVAGLGHMLGHAFIRNALPRRHRHRRRRRPGRLLPRAAQPGLHRRRAQPRRVHRRPRRPGFGLDARRRAVRRPPSASPCCSALLGPRGRADDVVIGSVFAWVLGLGVLFLSIFTTAHSSPATAAPASTCCSARSSGSTRPAGPDRRAGRRRRRARARRVIARPLLFASLDEAVAAARGVPVRAARPRLPRPGRRHRGRGDPGGRGAAAARAAGRPGRHRHAPDGPAVRGLALAVGHRRRGDVGRPGAQLRRAPACPPASPSWPWSPPPTWPPSPSDGSDRGPAQSHRPDLLCRIRPARRGRSDEEQERSRASDTAGDSMHGVGLRGRTCP